MSQSAYIFIVILFAFFLGTVILSNVVALLTSGVLRAIAFWKARKL